MADDKNDVGVVGSANRIDFGSLEESIGRIAKKQKTTMSKTILDLESIISTLDKSKNQLQLLSNINSSGGSGGSKDEDDMSIEQSGLLVPNIIDGLHKKLSESKLCSKIQADHKELHAPISKMGKTIERSIRSDIEQSAKDLDFDSTTVNQLILNHFYREGRFDIGDIFADEMHMDTADAEKMRSKFILHHNILNSIKRKEYQQTIDWCQLKRVELATLDSCLEFKLHKLQFIEFMVANRCQEAFEYARKHFAPFSGHKMREIQILMGAMVYADRLSASPYAHLFGVQSIESLWSDVKSSFSKDSFAVMGMARESPLFITINVGVQALPTFIKLSSFSVLRGVNDESLTVEVNVDDRYKYHSIFSCPVSREQSTKDNPPVLLQCGHLLSKNSMTKLVKGTSGKFKCPYCPTEQYSRDVKPIFIN